jgi:peptidoglycan/LPS O-acetylase OafA/YrhL
MNAIPHKTERLHSLDSLRAIMMMLGIVLHSAVPYMVTEFGFSKDPSATHLSIDIIFSIIHSFRMPAFMLVAGFFAAMLFYERSPLKMLKNRASRVLFPFIVFLLLLYPTLKFSRIYADATFAGSDHALEDAAAYFSDFLTFLPNSTWHLWFLYYLIFFTIISVLLALMFQKLPSVSIKISQIFNWVFQKPILRVFVFAGMTAVIFLSIGDSTLPHSNSLIPDVNVFIFYFSFYMVGWVLFKSKQLLDSFKQFDWTCTILALVLFALGLAIGPLKLIDTNPYQDMANAIVQSLVIWSFIFGITGLFIRYTSSYSARMRYISDASYWVYLLHYTLTIFIAPLLFGWDVHAIIKFLTVIISTTIICFVTYHYLVRSTFIGKFLNGRKYSRKLSDIQKQEELSRQKMALG